MGMTFEEVWAGMSGQQHHAFHMKVWAALGGQESGAANMEWLLAGKLRLKVEEVVEIFFDHNGRRIPPLGMKEVVDANRDFRFMQPMMGTADYVARLARIKKHLGEVLIDEFEFQQRVGAVLKAIEDDEQAANLLKCPHFPFVLPRIEVGDYGLVLDEVFLPAVGRAYTEQFPDRQFNNYRAGTLAGQVTVVEGSRHDRFLEALKQGPVCGVYFPCLQGFPLEGDVAQMETLPEQFLLAGAIDISAVQIMYPDVVAVSYKTPGLDCAALRWRGFSLCFGAFGGGLDFSDGDLYANGVYFAGGLVVLG